MGQQENELKRQILEYLERCGHTVWNTNQGRIRGKYRMGKKGAPDLQGFTNEGYYIGIEVKMPDNKLTDEQQRFKLNWPKRFCQ